MNKILKYMSVLFLISGLLVCTYARENGSGRLSKVDADPSIYKFNVNNISTFIYADGRADVDGNNSGFEYPKGSNKFAVYESGFNWGGVINGEVRFGGSTFPSGLVHGKIGQDPEDSRMFRVRPDYATGSMSSEILDDEKGGDEAAIRAQYRLDWDQWPWQDGAPYADVNGNGVYDADPDGNGIYDLGEDIPGFPGADQTIYFIANAADGEKSMQFYASPAQQIEMHATIWGYSRTGPLGNMIFKKYNLLNKGADDYTNFYVGVWNDPDVGNAGDDFAGCDTVLSLGFAYNANSIDNIYGERVPAPGYDFFQGPIVPSPGDTALVNGQKVPDWRNLGMTAYYYFVNENGTAYSDPDLDNYETGTLYFYNLLQGRMPTTGELFPIPESLGGGVTSFPLSGDPVAGTGYLDGMVKPAADRRFGMSSGPFTLAAGDQQEIVIAQMVAQGANNIESVRKLKQFDQVAQEVYDNNFVVPSAPPAPLLTYSVFDQEILLKWDSNPAFVAATENHSVQGYEFQGYNVYQLPTASAGIDDAVKIATFDLADYVTVIVDTDSDPTTGVDITKVVQNGTDSGVQRYFRVTKDYLTNADLFNGSRYYFAVTSYAYKEGVAIPRTLENVPSATTIVPQMVAPGTTLGAEAGATITSTHTGGSDGTVSVSVIDPLSLTGSSYKVTFAEGEEGPVWNLDNTTTQSRVLSNQTNQSGDADYLMVEGLMVKVAGPPAGFKTRAEAVEILYGGEPVNTDAAGAPFGGNYVWHGLNSNNTYFVSAGGSPGDINRWERFRNYLFARDFEIRFTDQLAYGVRALSDDAIIEVPFELWDIGVGTPNDASDDVRMIPIILENYATTVFHWDGDVDGYFGYDCTDWVYWMDAQDADGYNNFHATCVSSGGQGATYPYATDGSIDGYYMNWYGGTVYPIGRFVIGNYNLDITQPMPIPSGTVIRLHTNKPNTTEDEFTFTAPANSYSDALAREDVAEQVNVFPNPYYGANSQELNKYQRFVTFSHLPAKATIRIFNLAGQLVKTIEKTSTDQFQRWDLLNQQNLPVASGIYIAYIDMPDIGTTKVLKLAIIQEQQILDRF